MRLIEMQTLMENYRVSCNLLTERIEDINKQLKSNVTEEMYRELSSRRRTLREERLDILNTMKSLQEYCR
ncbi:MAG: hypothetical protein K2H01_01045 [Ruminococcus sp.]|nr:hypothetical protein [Ruminococcus sp.]